MLDHPALAVKELAISQLEPPASHALAMTRLARCCCCYCRRKHLMLALVTGRRCREEKPFALAHNEDIGAEEDAQQSKSGDVGVQCA